MFEIGGTTGNLGEVETGTLAQRVTFKANDIGAQGSFQATFSTGLVNAGVGAGSTWFALKNGSSRLLLIRRIILAAANNAASSAGGCEFSLTMARNFPTFDTGGTAITLGSSGRKRGSMANSTIANISIASTGILTPGTRTLDAQPFAHGQYGTLALGGQSVVPPGTVIFDPMPGDAPMVIDFNEGFVGLCQIASSMNWTAALTMEWDEVNVRGANIAT